MSWKHYWKYTLKPRLTNPFRVIRYHLWFKKKRDKERNSPFQGVFYADGLIEDSKFQGGYSGMSFKKWWIENASGSKGFALSHIRSLRAILKELEPHSKVKKARKKKK